MHKVNGDESRVVNVCIQGSTELTTASLIAPTRTPIPSQICKYTTSTSNSPIVFDSITPTPNVKHIHQLKLGKRWSPPSHFSETLWKPMPIEYIPPWHIFQAKKPSSKRTKVAHKAASFYNSARELTSNRSRSNAHKRVLKQRKQMAELMIVFLPVHLALIAWNKKSIDEHTMVFDGGNHYNPPLLPPPPHGTN